MDDTRPIHSLEDIFNDPDSDQLLIREQPKKTYTVTDPEIEKFKEVQQWIKDHNGQEPEKTSDISRLHERGLASWLIGVRRDADRIALLKPYDELGLLKDNSTVSLRDEVKEEKQDFDSLDDILNDDSVLLNSNSGKTLNEKLFDTKKLNEVKRERENEPDKVSLRKKMDGFEKYEPLFKQVQQDLASGRRQLRQFKNYEILRHHFYVLNGQLLYVESLGMIQKAKSKTNRKSDRRIHVIYENGTENTPLLNGLAASLYGRHGKIVTEPDDKFMFSGDDQATGYIYVLKSLSRNPQVQAIQAEHPLYKVGFTSNTVKQRIANAENESTYLYGPVEEVAEYQVINLDPEALETALHHALAQYRLDVDIKAANSKIIHPREWFVVDLDTINSLISEIISKLRIKF
ncbi:GIY-YIG nuclease family protein [Lactobacillus crispatus]|uniref:GIY-YIG nuclease family protein n=1 Tax=Lactobacillus crispatus TaxID=47770 RepID=UPI0015DA8A75|nr:GIY-YIG nuclease family protein [Lactobacillus crispatus]